MMRVFKKAVLIILTIILLTSFSFQLKAFENVFTPEDEKKSMFGAGLDFNRYYLWRGFKWSDGIVLQPSGWLSMGGTTFLVWANYVLNDESNQGKFDEVDLSLTYDLNISKISLKSEMIFYFYPNQDNAPTTGESIFTLSYPFFGPLSFKTGHAFDFIKYKKSYYGFASLFFDHALSNKISIGAEAKAGWGSWEFLKTYTGASKFALYLFESDFFISISPLKFFTIRPHAEICVIVDDEIKDALGRKTSINAGISAEFKF